MLQATFFVFGLAAVGITAWLASRGATAALRQATYDRLAATRETRARHLERYFEDLTNHVLALAADEATIEALEGFHAAWPSLPEAQATPELRTLYDRLGESEWLPGEGRVLALQSFYLAANPHPEGSRELLLSAPAAGAYDRTHIRFHPTLQRYRTAFGFHDIFLIDDSGRVLYTVVKEIDLGASLRAAPYRATTLARAFERALELPEPERAIVEDYVFYAPSQREPACFLASPIWRGGAKIGVLAIQVSVAEVNRVMTGNGNWRGEGLGESGQSYIVGADGALRSDLRFELESPEEFFRQLAAAGIDATTVRQVRQNRTSILTLRAPEQIAARIRAHGKGVETGRNLRGVEVLRSFAPLRVAGLDWGLVAEIDTAEAFAGVRQLQRNIVTAGLLLLAAFTAAAGWIGLSVTRPVLKLVESVKRLGGRDFGVRVPIASRDEIGLLAASFNRMAEELERTTVSKQQVDRILESLLNAVFVVGARRGGTPEDLRAAPVEQSNPAAEALLGRLDGATLGGLLPPQTPWLADLLERGTLPARETTLRGVPVLFTAAFLRDNGGLVCAAQDITERKLAEAELAARREQLELLTQRLIRAQEEERSRLARELHDDLTQRLAAVAIQAGRLEHTTQPDTLRAGLQEVKQHMATLAKDIHGLSRRLHPAMLEELGLVAALEAECRTFFERGGAPVELRTEGDADNLNADIRLALFRIAQEALNNIRRYAEATEVRIDLRRDAREVTLTVADDGRGFDRASTGWRRGLGLASMEERALALGGRFELESRPGAGTRLEVSVPLP
jgi:signal transduction histidine kinase